MIARCWLSTLCYCDGVRTGLILTLRHPLPHFILTLFKRFFGHVHAPFRFELELQNRTQMTQAESPTVQFSRHSHLSTLVYDSRNAESGAQSIPHGVSPVGEKPQRGYNSVPDVLLAALESRIPTNYLTQIGSAYMNGWLMTESEVGRGYFVRQVDRPGSRGGQFT